jgi:hypothetical protein
MGKWREVRGTNHRVREPVRLPDPSRHRDLTATPKSNGDHLQRLAELLLPKREDGTVP